MLPEDALHQMERFGEPKPDSVPPGKIRVTVEDEDGNTETTDVGPHDYVLLTVGACQLDGTQAYANGTHVLTIKGRR